MAIETDWTLEEFLRLPETKPALEFDCGRITQKVSPTTEHGLLQLRVGRLFDDLGLGRAMSELRTIYPDASKVPDVAFYVTSELPVTPRGGWLRYPEWSPSIAIEIASPKQDLDELRTKCRFYIEAGSKLALLVLPETEKVEVFAASEVSHTYSGETRIAELVDALGEPASAITAAAIFAALRP